MGRIHHQSIRPKSSALQSSSWLTPSRTHFDGSNDGAHISRAEAIEKVMAIIGINGGHPNVQDPVVLSLIELFNLQPEELSEAGLPYESIKAIEQRCLSWRLLSS